MKTKLLTDKGPAKTAREAEPPKLLAELRELILAARQTVARGVNAALVAMYWNIGQRIRRDILKKKRAEYGEEIVATLSRQLTLDFGAGFAEKNLRRMVQFAEVFPDDKIVATLSKELGWSHFVESLPLKKHLQRDFCAERIGIRQPVAAELTLADILSPVARVIASLPIPRDTCSSAPAIICQPVASKLTVTTGVMPVETRLPRNCQTLSGELVPRLTWVGRGRKLAATNPPPLSLDRRTRAGALFSEGSFALLRSPQHTLHPKLPRLLPLPFRRGWGEGLLGVVYPAVLAV